MNIFTRVFHVILIVAISSKATHSQPPSIQWQKTFGGTNFDQVESVIQTSDGGYIAAGISTSTNGNVTGNHGFGDVWVVKMTSLGVMQWQKSLGGSADDGAFAIIQTSDLGYVIAGTSTSVNGDVTVSHGSVDWWILKLNSSGTLLWQHSYGGSSVDIPYDIHETSDGGLIAAGYTVSNDGDVSANHGFEDFWIVKLSSTGNLQWEQTLGGSQDERAWSISQTSDGGYIAAGYTHSTDGDVTGNHGDYDYWLVKLSGTGALQWQKTLGGALSDQAHTVQQTTDGGYIVAGFTASINGDVTVNHGFEDLWMVKLNSSGSIQWQKSLGGSGVDQAFQIKQLIGGGYILGGSSYSLDGDVTGNHGGYDCWLARTDAVGNIIWQKSLGGSSVEECYALSLTTGNGYIFCGGTLSNDGDVTGNHGDFDYWIVKLNEVATAPLPVELVNFYGFNTGNKNILKWTTTSEKNNDHFEPEKRSGNEPFKTITRIDGHGTTNTSYSYTYEDKEIKTGTTYYYRLKQVDADGKYSYSKVIRIDRQLETPGIKVYPNPSAGHFNIYSELKNGQVAIFNAMGNKVYAGFLNDSGFQEVSLNIPPGIYSVMVSDGYRRFITLLMIK